jgi:hypothetical protein
MMVKRAKQKNLPNGLLGRLVIALLKGTGTRLTADEVQALRPILLSAVKDMRERHALRARPKGRR